MTCLLLLGCMDLRIDPETGLLVISSEHDDIKDADNAIVTLILDKDTLSWKASRVANSYFINTPDTSFYIWQYSFARLDQTFTIDLKTGYSENGKWIYPCQYTDISIRRIDPSDNRYHDYVVKSGYFEFTDIQKDTAIWWKTNYDWYEVSGSFTDFDTRVSSEVKTIEPEEEPEIPI